MPAMGPGVPSGTEVDKLFNSVVDFLEKEHKILKTPWSGYPWVGQREAANVKLREALAEVLKIEVFSSF